MKMWDVAGPQNRTRHQSRSRKQRCSTEAVGCVEAFHPHPAVKSRIVCLPFLCDSPRSADPGGGVFAPGYLHVLISKNKLRYKKQKTPIFRSGWLALFVTTLSSHPDGVRPRRDSRPTATYGGQNGHAQPFRGCEHWLGC